MNIVKLKQLLDACEEIDDDARLAVELCARTICSVECFDVKQLMLHIALRQRDREVVCQLLPD
jgi:hypothetical protein